METVALHGPRLGTAARGRLLITVLRNPLWRRHSGEPRSRRWTSAIAVSSRSREPWKASSPLRFEFPSQPRISRSIRETKR
jgi:hypothetical protein